MSHLVAIDEGTTGVSALRIDGRGREISRAYSEFTQYYPRPGWVEHDPREIWRATLGVLRKVVGGPGEVAAIGITNQRETTVLWNRRTGDPVHPAIVWQCRRTAGACEELRKRGHEGMIRRKTGLLLDPYFSATKLQWLLKNLRPKGDVCFGTIDTWLLWNLTRGKVHATDVTNASRTLLFNIDRRDWDDDLLRLFGIPRSILPEVRASTASFGTSAREILGREIPLFGVAGDQQAALFGQGCVSPGSMKNTYGTGGFLMVNTGPRRFDSKAGLLTTLACGARGEPTYALEGAVFIAGAAIQFLRDSLKIVRTAEDTEALARSVPSSGGVYFVPAFVGLGAPYWDAEARGAIVGLTRGTGRAEIVRAALEAIAYQTRDMIEAGLPAIARAMSRRPGRSLLRELKVDGGATRNNFLMQFQADLLQARLVRPKNISSTALGAGFLAGVGAGVFRSRSDIPPLPERVFVPKMARDQADGLFLGWRRAVARVLNR
jgi:glycerol kinase